MMKFVHVSTLLALSTAIPKAKGQFDGGKSPS